MRLSKVDVAYLKRLSKAPGAVVAFRGKEGKSVDKLVRLGLATLTRDNDDRYQVALTTDGIDLCRDLSSLLESYPPLPSPVGYFAEEKDPLRPHPRGCSCGLPDCPARDTYLEASE